MAKVIVIGAGASGLMAACVASQNGHEVALFEKNEQLGKKLQLTGHGRCNITNKCSKDDFFKHVVHNEKFLYSAFSQFSNMDMIDFLKQHGMVTVEEDQGRMFPSSQSAKDVVLMFVNLLKENRVKLHMNEACQKLIIEGNAIQGIETEKKRYPCDVVIVATGGKSFESTGSTGDGYIWARQAGIQVSDVYPGLVSLKTVENFDLAGLSLKNIGIQVKKEKKTLYKGNGDILFTHQGLSGPAILAMSSYVMNQSPQRIILDLIPSKTVDEVDHLLLKNMDQSLNQTFKHVLDHLIPKRLSQYVLSTLSISETIKVHETTKKQRRSVAELLKNCSFQILEFGNFNEAMITVGGIKTNQINPKTMESKTIQGLKFVGEVLDLDAQTGGYNLQIAWTTGFVAANTIW